MPVSPQTPLSYFIRTVHADTDGSSHCEVHSHDIFFNMNKKMGRSWILVATVTCALLTAKVDLENFSGGVRIVGDELVVLQNVAEVIDAVRMTDGRKIVVLGSLWSWNRDRLEQNDALYVRLSGDFKRLHRVADDRVVAGSAATVADLYELLESATHELPMVGQCYSSGDSQTIGGLIASNVHGGGGFSMIDVVEWIEFVDGTGVVRNASAGTLAHAATHGGMGRTGVIVRAQLILQPVRMFRHTGLCRRPTVTRASPWTEAAGRIVQRFRGIGRNEGSRSAYEMTFGLGLGYVTICFDVTMMPNTGYRSQTDILVRDNADTSAPNYGVWTFSAPRAIEWTSQILRPLLFTPLAVASMLSVVDIRGDSFEFLPFEGNRLMRRNAAASSAFNDKRHIEFELFIPCDMVTVVLERIMTLMRERDLWYTESYAVFQFRYTYGSDSPTAGNRITDDGSRTDYIAVNILLLQESYWPLATTELDVICEDLQELPVYIHPGKWQCNALSRKERSQVSGLIRTLDPHRRFS